MKKLMMLASALALTLCMGQAYSTESGIPHIYSDTVTTDKVALVNNIQRVISQFDGDGRGSATNLFDENIPDWLGFAHCVADYFRDALKMIDSDSDEIKEAEDFVKKVLNIRNSTDGNHDGVKLDGYNEEDQDSINEINDEIPAKIEKLKALLDQLNNEDSAQKVDEPADENKTKEEKIFDENKIEEEEVSDNDLNEGASEELSDNELEENLEELSDTESEEASE